MRAPILALILALPLLAAAQGKGPPLPEGPKVDAAKAAYNKGEYAKAGELLLALCQDMPHEPGLYRALARARVYGGEPVGAIIAYRFYLQLAPEAGDKEKITAELALALQRVKTPPPEGPPPAPAAKLRAAVERAKAGQFIAETGAFHLFDEALKRGMLGPEIAEARAAISTALEAKSMQLLDDWWRLDVRLSKLDLEQVERAWQRLASRRSITAGEAKPVAIVEGLVHLEAKAWGKVIDALAPVAGGDPRLRYAQIIALAKLNRLDEALQLLEATSRAHPEPRFALLRGLLLHRAGRPGAGARFKEALAP